MSTHIDYENSLLQAIQTVVDSSIDKTDADKIIKGTVLKCLDAETGEYLIKYQDGTFSAFSINEKIKYENDSLVYIILPNGDINDKKIILYGDSNLSGIPDGGSEGQVLIKNSSEDGDVTWGGSSAATAISGDHSIEKIVSLTLEEYMALGNNRDPKTVYHILDSNEMTIAPIADNLITDSDEYALSARQGKILNEKIPKNPMYIESQNSESISGVKGPSGSIYMYSLDGTNNRGIYGYNANNEPCDILAVGQNNHVFVGGIAGFHKTEGISTPLKMSATKGFISYTDTTSVNTPSATGTLVIKKVSNSEAPNNGVVLEFGNSTSWTGQLYIGDNATQGIYYNGWSNGNRGSWRRLAETPVTLYDNGSGTQGTVTLNQSSGNFTYVEIFYSGANASSSYCSSVKVYSPNGKKVGAVSTWYGQDNGVNVMYTYRETFVISGTSITRESRGSGYTSSEHYCSAWQSDYFKIYRVVGYY